MSGEFFGFPADDEGNISFLSVRTNFLVTSYEAYQEMFALLVQIAEDNPGIMPVLVFDDNENKD